MSGELRSAMQHANHDVVIGAPRDLAATRRPALLQRSDDDFIGATLEALRAPAGRAALRAKLARATDAQGRLKLFQPIQRQFHVALIEAWCDTPGAPRIDPKRVDAAGLVVRRLGPQGAEGWMHANGQVRGWVPLARIGGETAEPQAAARLTARLTGVAQIDRQLSLHAREDADHPLEEQISGLYLAPPDVNADAGKTLFYGLVPTTSSELSDVPPAPTGDDGFGAGSDAFRNHLVEALRGDAMDLPFPGDLLVPGWFEASESPGVRPPDGVTQNQFNLLQQDVRTAAGATALRMQRFLLFLRQIAGEFNAFAGGNEVKTLKTILASIQLPLVLRPDEKVVRFVRADQFLAKASAILLEQTASASAVEMPAYWPALAPADATRLKNALHQALQARLAAMQTQAGRYDEPTARYSVRAFVRLKPEGHCPARTVWSEPSEPFVIAPWYEGGGAPPVQIRLPDASDRTLLKALKPNVAFIVPPSMQNLLSGKAKDLLEGKGSVGTAGLSWICSFNIPVITICAFIVLNIFLTLFNLVFGWLFFIKICIPFPKLGNKPPGGSSP